METEENNTPIDQKSSTEKAPLTGKARALANLRPPWKPGYCPNPVGRKKGSKSFKTICKEILKWDCPEEISKSIKKTFKNQAPEKLSNEVALGVLAVKYAMAGNEKFYDRLFGKVADVMEESNKINMGTIISEIHRVALKAISEEEANETF